MEPEFILTICLSQSQAGISFLTSAAYMLLWKVLGPYSISLAKLGFKYIDDLCDYIGHTRDKIPAANAIIIKSFKRD